VRRALPAVLVGLALAVAGVVSGAGDASAPDAAAPSAAEVEPEPAVAVFAGGCFWCMEKPFDEIDGVVSTTSGYTGGHVADPSYEDVTRGDTGHVEAVRVVYEPERVGYERLLAVFWRNVDPFDDGGQFCDRGDSYRSAIFAADAEQRRAAAASRAEVAERFERPVATRVLDPGPFYPAESYHQDYYRKNPLRYRFYRSRCGRDGRLEALWGEVHEP